MKDGQEEEKKAEVNIHSTPRIPLVLDYKPRFTWARGRKPPVRLSIWYASGEIRSGWRWLHKTGHYKATSGDFDVTNCNKWSIILAILVVLG